MNNQKKNEINQNIFCFLFVILKSSKFLNYKNISFLVFLKIKENSFLYTKKLIFDLFHVSFFLMFSALKHEPTKQNSIYLFLT